MMCVNNMGYSAVWCSIQYPGTTWDIPLYGVRCDVLLLFGMFHFFLFVVIRGNCLDVPLYGVKCDVLEIHGIFHCIVLNVISWSYLECSTVWC